MRMPATPFFRDIRMPSAWNASHERERFMLDTLADRKEEEKPRTVSRIRSLARRGAAMLGLA